MAFNIKIPEEISAKLPKIDEKNRKYVIWAVLLAIFLGDYFLIMQPFQLKNLMDINPKITVLEKDLKQAKTDIQRIDQYQQQVKTLTAKQEKIGNRILSTEEIPFILENISLIAQRNNVVINQIVPLRESLEMVLKNEDGQYFSLPILINAKGGYHDLGRFINGIEHNQLFMSITALDVAASGDDPRLHSARLTIKAYVIQKE